MGKITVEQILDLMDNSNTILIEKKRANDICGISGNISTL